MSVVVGVLGTLGGIFVIGAIIDIRAHRRGRTVNMRNVDRYHPMPTSSPPPGAGSSEAGAAG
jgi:hypothetical protein